MTVNVGDRVGAILCIDGEEKVIKLLGYGVYEGRFPVEGLGKVIEDFTGEKAEPEDLMNPRVKLDNGSVVWGYQMWWGPENETKDTISELVASGFRVEEVTLTPEEYL